MIERRIAFVTDHEGLPSWVLSKLKSLAGYFKSCIVIHNISQDQQADISQLFHLLSMGTQNEDLCQLCIEGIDAELAAMVLTDVIAEHFTLICTDPRQSAKGAILIDNHPAFSLPFECHIDVVTGLAVANKAEMLGKQATLLAACFPDRHNNEITTQLFDQFHEREAISSTGMGKGIALPHIMADIAPRPAISIISCLDPIDWYSAQGDIGLSIAMLLPEPAQRAHIVAFAGLSKALLSPRFSQSLLANAEPDALKAIILNTMSQAIKRHDT
ncbi:PTS sugar transporter subunit IIA [Thaumasiovibrio subtropicus]|uniref:PTS sugar transporter subunit IIA n=1 Tax=Thaumasiovibrio subtropicus TaxID=1891207 RepID=UPI000B34FDCF|nr:PTS sugar transporter subunit IIA [Thaumasiovibrio subtropicus]